MPETTHRRDPQPDHRTLDQQRAAFAWRCVVEARRILSDKQFESYTNLAKSAPALVMGNGLMQTLAFFEQKYDEKKGKDLHARELNRALCTWLAEKTRAVVAPDYPAVMEGLHGAGPAQYLQATEEALEILRWIRQFAPTLKG